jgi:hypothetical protein
MEKRKTKLVYRGNNFNGLQPRVGLVMDEGYVEAVRYANGRALKVADISPHVPRTADEAMERECVINTAIITRGQG